MLTDMKKQAASEMVFPNPEGGFIRDNCIRTAFNWCFKKAGLAWTATRILRHTFATWNLEANGSNISAVQAAMGHKRRATREIHAKPLASMTGELVDRGADRMMKTNHVQIHIQEKSKSE
ncbi:MAG: tyrosine-type recombinase/integrase [Oligoflexus sp.]|nr:tyrosine-type recombinase/integrase [Oligoflexus sp.]